MPAARAQLLRGLRAFDLACSRFRDDSELTRCSTARAGRSVPVGALLWTRCRSRFRPPAQTDGDRRPHGRAHAAPGRLRPRLRARAPRDGRPSARERASPGLAPRSSSTASAAPFASRAASSSTLAPRRRRSRPTASPPRRPTAPARACSCPWRRHRRCGRAARRRLADPHRRRPRGPARRRRDRPSRSPRAGLRPRARRCAAGRQHAANTTTSSTPAPAARRRALADGDRRRALLRRRQHRQHGRDRPRRRRARLARGTRHCRHASSTRRRRLPCRRLARSAEAAMTLARSQRRAYWFLTRGTGVVTLVLLTASVVPRRADERPLAQRRAGRASSSTRCTATSRCSPCVPRRPRRDDGPRRLRADPASRTPSSPSLSPYRPIWLGLGAARLRPLLAARGHEPPARAARLPRSGGRRTGLPTLLAGRARARAGHGQRRAHRLARRARLRVRSPS